MQRQVWHWVQCLFTCCCSFLKLFSAYADVPFEIKMSLSLLSLANTPSWNLTVRTDRTQVRAPHTLYCVWLSLAQTSDGHKYSLCSFLMCLAAVAARGRAPGLPPTDSSRRWDRRRDHASWSTPLAVVELVLLPQALVSGGLATLAKDPTFVSQTKEEMADAMHTTVDDMESVAQGILSQRSGPIPPAKKKRAVPLPPPPAAHQTSAPPDPAVRKKRRPVPIIPSSQGLSGSNPQV